MNSEIDQCLFDAYVFVDWSSSSSPKTGKDSIWIASYEIRESQVPSKVSRLKGAIPKGTTLLNPSTRFEATQYLHELLSNAVDFGQNVLVGFDFSLGLPFSSLQSFGFSHHVSFWSFLAEAVEDDDSNKNNRFELASRLNRRAVENGLGSGPFWGCPALQANSFLGTKKSLAVIEGSVETWRVCEQQMRLRKFRPFSIWQLMGAGAVGSQSLLGIPRMVELMRVPGISDCSTVWPFETGFQLPDLIKNKIVFAEFWPSLLDVNLSLHPIVDAAQVLSAVQWAINLDRQGVLRQMFAPKLFVEGDSSSSIDKKQEVLEEGWVLGFNPT